MLIADRAPMRWASRRAGGWLALGSLWLAAHAHAAAQPASLPPPESPAPAVASAAAAAATANAHDLRLDDAMADRMLACTACHGVDGRAGPDGYYPRLAGKPAGYLYQQLVHFRDGYRLYEPMTVLLRQLPDAYLHDIAGFFANQHPPYPPPERTPATREQLQRGEALVFSGDPARQLPACTTCHGANLAGSEPALPGLLGLPRDYLVAQLGAWQVGTRRTPAPDCMATVAQRLTPADLAAVTAWLASRPVPADYRPAPEPPAQLPMSCYGISAPEGQP